MKKLTLAIVIVLTMISCNKKLTENDNKLDTLKNVDKEVVDNHAPNNSLDYEGVYKGIIPCADCNGIETILELKSDAKYTLFKKYIETNDKGTTQTGTFTWNDKGTTITLSGIENEPNQYFVGENQIFILDMEGKKIEGKMANLYILKKEVKEDVVQAEFQSVVGKKYKLIELNGKKIDTKKKDFFIEFNKDGRFSAFAGCNNMAGEYKVENTFRIKFSKVLSTMMACDDMATEKELAEVLELTDNLSINEKSLSLNKARMAPLARFELIK